MPSSSYALCIFVAACGSFAQQADGQGIIEPVTLTVIATDHAGKPVTDLKPADLQLQDNGAPVPVVSLQHSSPNPAPTVVVLLDLMDLRFEQRSYEAKQLRTGLVRQPGGPAIYLYLLGADGHVYVAPRATESAAAFDLAMESAPQQRPDYFGQHPEERFKSASAALAFLDRDLRRLPGRKQLIWITDGIPNKIAFQGQGWIDLTPNLRQLAANLNHEKITVYTLDPSLALGTLNREGLDVITAATGGLSFASSDLSLVLNQTRVDPTATYVLEYAAPLSAKKHAKLHTVRISTDRKDVHLRAQLAYLSAAPAAVLSEKAID